MQIWTRYPKKTHPITRSVINANQYGAVVHSDAWRIYGNDFDPSKPDWSDIDERINSLPSGYPIHIHPILNRGPAKNLQKMMGNFRAFVYPTLERYGDRVQRFTISNELLLVGADVQDEVIKLFADLGNDFPSLKFWIGEYGLRSNHRVHATNGIIEAIYKLQNATDSFEGIVCIDYLDLSHSAISFYLTGIKKWLGLPGSLVAKSEPETVADWLALIEQRYKVVAAPAKLGTNLKAISETEAKIALETAVYTGPDPSNYTVARQKKAYEMLINTAQEVDADLWMWEMCDASASITWNPERRATDCPGWFDRNGVAKDWAGELLREGKTATRQPANTAQERTA